MFPRRFFIKINQIGHAMIARGGEYFIGDSDSIKKLQKKLFCFETFW